MPHFRNAYTVFVGKQHRKAGRRWKYSSKMNLKKQDMKARTGVIKIRIGTVAGSCEHGNELPVP
jgi:hypothetical protein